MEKSSATETNKLNTKDKHRPYTFIHKCVIITKHDPVFNISAYTAVTEAQILHSNQIHS